MPEPTTVAIVITTIADLLKGATFTKTPHLSWTQSNDLANQLKKPMAQAFANKHGSDLSTVSKYHNIFVSYLDVQAGQKSWNIEAYTIAKDSIADAQNYLFGSDQNAEHYLDIMMWRWVMYVAMNYDSRRPNEFKTELQSRTITVFDFDPLVTSTDQNSIPDNVNSFIKGIFSGLGSLFGGNTTTSDGQQVTKAGMNAGQIILGVGLIFGIFYFYKKLK